MSGVRFVLVPEVRLSLEVRLPPLRDSVVLPIARQNTYQPRFFEFRETSRHCFVGNLDATIFEIVSNTAKIVAGTSFIEKLQDDVIASCHPVRPVPGHTTIPEEPSNTLFDVTYSVFKIRHSVLFSSQTLSRVGNHLDTEEDATLLGGGVTEKIAVCDAAWIQHGRRVGPREGCRPMSTQARREQKSPARSDASPADHLRASAEQLSSTKARAVRALVSIHQLHLSEFQS
jgi:hypothetical protein